MAAIRPENEIDRTRAALAADGATLPLPSGRVEIEIAAEQAASPVGQRLLVTLVNELARMKGVVSAVHVLGAAEQDVLPGVPLTERTLAAGLAVLVDSLNAPSSELAAQIEFSAAAEPAARALIGDAPGGGLSLGADAWRALLGARARESDWHAHAPYGAALAAALAGAEMFKAIVKHNVGPDPARRVVQDLAYSAFNFGIDANAAIGPDITSLRLQDLAVVGCGAGGTAALYVLAMQPGLSGEIALIEPNLHKLSNLNRYLMSSAADVHTPRHKLASVTEHLARHAPALHPTLYAQPWALLSSPPWGFLLCTVDTLPARWAIQSRARAGAEILDGAVQDMLYAMLKVQPGGWCLNCKHPYDPDLALKERANSWGVSVETIRDWTARDSPITTAMIESLAEIQNRPVAFYAELEGVPFGEVPRLTECGETALQTDVPSQAAVLPVATTPLGALLAAEIAKHDVAPQAQLSNWLAHDLGRSPARNRIKWRPAKTGCPRHDQ
jgi:ThiF family